MSLKELVQTGWRDHGDDAESVWTRLPEGLALVENGGDALMLSSLALHVAGEHLGLWDEGLRFLERVRDETPAGEDEGTRRALARQAAVLEHCAGREPERDARMEEGRDPDRPAGSTDARVLAIASSALSGQRRGEEATAAFRRALEAASYGPASDDPAARALAVTANNLACELEERPDRDAEDDALLREAAHAARRFWEIAGDWRNVKIAEYRLAKTHLALGEPATALEHAATSLRLCDENDGGPVDRFFAHEVMALARRAAGEPEAAREQRDAAAARLAEIDDEGNRQWCGGELEKLDAALKTG